MRSHPDGLAGPRSACAPNSRPRLARHGRLADHRHEVRHRRWHRHRIITLASPLEQPPLALTALRHRRPAHAPAVRLAAVDRATRPLNRAHGVARHHHSSRQAAAARLRTGEAVDAEVRALVDDMFETMYEAPGVGLAAIQIGVPKRVVTVDTAKKDEREEPAGLHQSGDRLVVGREGHLRGRLPVDPGILRGGRAAREGEGPLHGPRRQDAGDRGGRPAGDRAAARDRPPQRRAVHRPHLEAQARPRRSRNSQGGEARAGDRSPTDTSSRTARSCRCASSSWARRTSRCRR